MTLTFSELALNILMEVINEMGEDEALSTIIKMGSDSILTFEYGQLSSQFT